MTHALITTAAFLFGYALATHIYNRRFAQKLENAYTLGYQNASPTKPVTTPTEN